MRYMAWKIGSKNSRTGTCYVLKPNWKKRAVSSVVKEAMHILNNVDKYVYPKYKEGDEASSCGISFIQDPDNVQDTMYKSIDIAFPYESPVFSIGADMPEDFNPKYDMPKYDMSDGAMEQRLFKYLMNLRDKELAHEALKKGGKVMHKRKQLVVLEVRGGVVFVVKKPKNVIVRINDFDTDTQEEL